MTPDEFKAEREARAFGEAIEESLNRNTAAIKEVTRWRARIARRFYIAISLVVVAFLVVGLTLVKLNQEKLAACQGTNAVRAEATGLWAYLIHLSAPPPNETPAEAKRREDTISAFMTRVDVVYKPSTCKGIF